MVLKKSITVGYGLETDNNFALKWCNYFGNMENTKCLKIVGCGNSLFLRKLNEKWNDKYFLITKIYYTFHA